MDTVATDEYIRRSDAEASYPYELYDAWVEAELLRVPFPEEYGGHGGGVAEMVVIAEELGRKSYDFFGAYASGVFTGLTLLAHGSPQQKKHWIGRLQSGQSRMSVSISEPEAGSDVSNMRTRAKRVDGGWVIDGQKLWSSGAGAKDNVMHVYAVTGESDTGRKQISLFLVDNNAPGVQLRKLDMLGRRCVGTYEVFLDGVEVRDDRLVGEEGAGWTYLRTGLDFERIAGAAAYTGSAQAIVDLAADHARTRKQFGSTIGSFQAIAHLLADMQTRVFAARALTHQVAERVADGESVGAEVSMAKLFASETLVAVAGDGMQIMGASGYSMEFDMQRMYRDARGATIAGGTSQMQRNAIAKSMGLGSSR
ncbi:MAG: hypothetical protein JWQ19_2063 [Subtercola sp.]|nr:hypothetical protein [Subtercola sp.]